MISFFRVFFLYCFFFHVCLEKTNDLGVSLEIIQTLSKLAPNSYVFIVSVVIFFSIYIYIIYFFSTRGMSLEWVWRFSRLSPNSYYFLTYSIFLWKRGMSLEWLWRFSKFFPNAPQTRSKLKGFHFFYFIFFLEKRNEFGASLESLQTLSKLSPNPLQTQVFFWLSMSHYVTTEKTASPGSPAKLS